MAHSALDFREPAALAIAGAVCRGEFGALTGRGAELDAMSARLPIRALWKAIELAAMAEHALPAPLLHRRVSSA